jgi:hypothetical protein
MTVVVPDDALTGPIHVVGDVNGTQALLQIVPVVDSVELTTSDEVRALGRGFVEGDATYRLGTGTVIDIGARDGPEVSGLNDQVTFAPPPSEPGVFTVTTAGGTSAPVAWGGFASAQPALAAADGAGEPLRAAFQLSAPVPEESAGVLALSAPADLSSGTALAMVPAAPNDGSTRFAGAPLAIGGMSAGASATPLASEPVIDWKVGLQASVPPRPPGQVGPSWLRSFLLDIGAERSGRGFSIAAIGLADETQPRASKLRPDGATRASLLRR